jgi:hypothetical protein
MAWSHERGSGEAESVLWSTVPRMRRPADVAEID